MSQTAWDTRTHGTLLYDYRFQESSGALIDFGPNGVDLTADLGGGDGSAGYEALAGPFSPGDAGTSIDFGSGGTNRIEKFSGTISDLDTSRDWAIEAVVNPRLWSSPGTDFPRQLCGWTHSTLINDHWFLLHAGGDEDFLTLEMERGSDNRVDLETTTGVVDEGVWASVVAIMRADATADWFVDGSDVSGTETTSNKTIGVAPAGTLVVGDGGGDNTWVGYIARLRVYQTNASFTSLPDATFWSNHHDDITAAAGGGSNLPAIMNHYRRLRAA